MPGPQRTPTEVLARRGSTLAPRRKGEPPALADGERAALAPRRPIVPAKPDEPLFDEVAERKWDAITRDLDAMGVLSCVDRHVITRYCVLYSRWVRAEKFLAEQMGGAMIAHRRDSKGNPIQGSFEALPQVAIAAKLFDQMLKIEDRFGLTPSSRASIRMDAALGEKAVVETQEKKGKARFFDAVPVVVTQKEDSDDT